MVGPIKTSATKAKNVDNDANDDANNDNDNNYNDANDEDDANEVEDANNDDEANNVIGVIGVSVVVFIIGSIIDQCF